jgi:hypothetical protein
LSNLQEFIFGTNPVVADSASTALVITHPTVSTAALQFQTLRDRNYKVYYRDSLTSTWTQAGSDIAGTGSTYNWVDNGSLTGSAPTTHRFYQLQVGLVP